MNQKEVLSEANSLVAGGLRKAAVDLLLEYLEIDNDSAKVHAALGRAYLVDKQPERAVVHLKRSLELKQAGPTVAGHLVAYNADSFDDDDMAYVESQGDESSAWDYTAETDDPEFSSKSSKSTPEVVKKQGILPLDSVGSSGELVDDNDAIHGAKPQSEPSTPENEDTEPSIPLTPEAAKGATGRYNSDENSDTDWFNDDFELVAHDQPFLDGFLDDDDLSVVLPESEHNELDESDPFISEEDDPDLASWDEFDNLDEWDELSEFDPLASREDAVEVQTDGSIDRESRARQIAVEVLDHSGWDMEWLALLQQIFVEHGWSASRIAIERAISKGMQPEELALARKIRQLWKHNEQYWMTFHKIRSNIRFQQTDAAYKQMSWPEALRIIRCYSSIPDIEEIDWFIDESFDYWYNSQRMRRAFKAFFWYLKYRTGTIRQTLAGDYPTAFGEPTDVDAGVDSIAYCDPNAAESLILRDLGLDLAQWSSPPQYYLPVYQGQLE